MHLAPALHFQMQVKVFVLAGSINAGWATLGTERNDKVELFWHPSVVAAPVYFLFSNARRARRSHADRQRQLHAGCGCGNASSC